MTQRKHQFEHEVKMDVEARVRQTVRQQWSDEAFALAASISDISYE